MTSTFKRLAVATRQIGVGALDRASWGPQGHAHGQSGAARAGIGVIWMS